MTGDRKIRVLQLGTSGPLYGAERWILALCRNLDARKFDCRIAAIDDDENHPPPLLAAAKAACIPGHSIGRPSSSILGTIRSLRNVIRDKQIDIVHSHGYKADVVTLAACLGLPVKTLATPHGWSRGAGWKLAAYERADRFLFRFFDAVAPLSQELLGNLPAGLGQSNHVQLISNGVDIDEIDAAMAAKDRQYERQAFTIGYIGQLIARKDVRTLLHAFALLDEPSCELVVVGEGPEKAALEKMASQLNISRRTQFTGFRNDRIALLGDFDLFILPSLEEGIPRCLMEAMAARIPVIASNIPGSTDLVVDGKTGRLFEPRNARQLAALMRKAMKGQSADMAVAARRHIEHSYSASRMARDYEELFEMLTERKTAARAKARTAISSLSARKAS